MKISSLMALAYLFMALMGLALIAPTMPPFQNADEPGHLLRADQISHLGLLPQRLPDGQQGGWVDSGLVAAEAAFAALHRRVDAKTSRALYAPVPWGALAPAGFPNTAIYPPMLYLPQATALFVGRHWPLTVLQAAMLARLSAGLAAILLGAAALRLTTSGAIWLYAILLLPMSLALTAAASQDGLSLACTALAAALVQRLQQRGTLTELAAASILFALVACGRPPYIAFAAALMSARMKLRERFFAIGLVFVAVAVWSAIAAPHVVLPVFPQGAVDPAAQAAGLLKAPLRIPGLIVATWHAHGAEISQSFIGKPGWLDVGLPRSFHVLARMMLGCAAVIAVVSGSWARPRAGAVLAACGILAVPLGIGLAQYLTWTPPGAPIIEGLQGRYFLPPAMMLITLLPPGEHRVGWLSPFRVAVMLFPAFGIAVTVHALLLRYYL
jgi:hypothetical protein